MAVARYTARGARLYISSAVTTVPANAAAYAALTWTEVQNVRTFSPFGEVRPVISRVVVGRDHPVKKVGPVDPGGVLITLYPDDGDPGQIALANAAGTRSKYPIKIEHPAGSKLIPIASVSARYFSVIVAANANQLGTPDDLATDQFNLEIISQIIRIASEIPADPVQGALSVTLGSLTLTSGDVSYALLVGGNTLSVDGKVLTL